MKAFEGSLSYRVGRCALSRVGAVARCSLVGRFLVALVRVLGRVFVDSWVFGLRHTGSRRLRESGHPLSVLAISRPYLWLRGISDRVLCPSTRFTSRWFGGGAWLLVLGAGIFGLGCGRMALYVSRGVADITDAGLASAVPQSRLILPILFLVIGATIFIAGPRLVPASRRSLITGAGRWLGVTVVEGRALAPGPLAGVDEDVLPGPFFWRKMASPLGAAVILAAAAGLLGGLTQGSGALVLVALVVALCVLVLVFWRPEVMLLAVAVFPWLDWAARRSLGGFGPAWDDAFLVLSVVVLLWSVIALRRSELSTVPITLPVLLALAAAVGSVVVREVPGDVGFFAIRVLFQPLLFYFFGFLFPKNKRWVQWIVAAFLLTGVALALHGLYQYFTHAPMPAHWVDVREAGDIQTRAYSIIDNPNGLGAFLLMGALLSLGLALARGLSAVQRWVMAAVCLIHLAGIAVTFSRGAWLGLAAGILALMIMAYRRYLAPLVGAGILAWLLLPQKFVNRLTFAFSSTYFAKSLVAGRLYVWKMSLQHIAAHPLFGVGLGTFGGTSAYTFGYSRLWVDNFYLQLGAEGGLVLLALFVWVLLRGAKGLVASHRTTSDPFLRAVTSGVFGAWIAVAVANVTASVWETLVVGVGFWFLAGLATSAVQTAEAAPESVNPTAGDDLKEFGA